MLIRFVAGIIALSALVVHAVAAHHAFSANYDVNSTGTVEGVVEEVFWANPHVHYYLRVTTADGSDELWDAENMNLNTMARRGWNKQTVTVGDEIRVTGKLGRDGKRRISMDEVVRVDGRPLP